MSKLFSVRFNRETGKEGNRFVSSRKRNCKEKIYLFSGWDPYEWYDVTSAFEWEDIKFVVDSLLDVTRN